MKKQLAFCLLLSLILTILFPHQPVFAKASTRIRVNSGQQAIEELQRVVKEILQDKTMPTSVKRIALEKAVTELNALVNKEIGYFTGLRDTARNDSTILDKTRELKVQSFDNEIQRLENLLANYTVTNLMQNSAISDGNNDYNVPTPAVQNPQKRTNRINPRNTGNRTRSNVTKPRYNSVASLNDTSSSAFATTQPQISFADGNTLSSTRDRVSSEADENAADDPPKDVKKAEVKFAELPREDETKIKVTVSIFEPEDYTTGAKLKVYAGEGTPDEIADEIEIKGKTFASDVTLKNSRKLKKDENVKLLLFSNGKITDFSANAKVVAKDFVADAANTPPVQISVTDTPEISDKVLVARVLNFKANIDAKKLKSPTMKIKAGTDETKTVFLQRVADGSAEAILNLGRELQSGETIIYQVFDGETEVTRETLTVFAPIDATRGGLFGVMGGGIVASRQAQTTNEAAPFTFFQAGYGSKVFGAENEIKIFKEPKDNDPVTKSLEALDFSGCSEKDIRQIAEWRLTFNKLISNPDTPNSREFTRRSRGNDFDIKDDVYKNGDCEIELKKSFTPFTGRNTYRISFRLQGLFSTESRASLAFPIAGELPPNQPNRPFPFLNNRQTFSPEITTWMEFRPLSQFSFGPYITVGASTLLESAIKDKESIFDRETNQEVQSRVVTPVGTKFYGEIGAMQHLKFNPGKFFVQNFLGFGYYDQFRNAAYKFNDTPCTNNNMNCPERDLIGGTRFRFVEKLRIFPYGFNPNFARQVTVAPMFGVDLNVGKGPDNVRFFTGFVVNIGRFAGAPATEEEKKQ